MGAQLMSINASDWWHKLKTFRFLLAPSGTAIQVTKTIEALLVLTIPIVERGPYPTYDDLVQMGFPIVVVESWQDITRKKLDEWWLQLSPCLETFRKNLTTDRFWHSEVHLQTVR